MQPRMNALQQRLTWMPLVNAWTACRLISALVPIQRPGALRYPDVYNIITMNEWDRFQLKKRGAFYYNRTNVFLIAMSIRTPSRKLF